VNARIAALAVAVAIAALGPRPAAADDHGDDPRVLFAAGRYAAAAEVFEHRWSAAGDPVDGVNAVVAWRTAGRYARAAALLARVRAAKQPPSGDAAATATELEQRLATLTATATLERVPAAAVVRIDSDPPDRIAGAMLLDVGEHDVVVEQEGCDAFVWHAIAYPGARLAIPYAPRCDRTGTLHVYLDGDLDATFAVDGVRHATRAGEADLALAPGLHELVVASHSRLVVDEPVAIATRRTTAVRVPFPWRARRFGWILGATTEVRAGQVMDGVDGGLTVGVWGARFRATFDVGSAISDTPGLRPDTAGPGHPWVAATGAIHVFTRPLWHGRLGSFRLALDVDPVAMRFDEYRAASYFGIRAQDAIEARVRGYSFLPIALSADGAIVHVELTLWPLSYATYHTPIGGPTVEPGFSAFATLIVGLRL